MTLFCLLDYKLVDLHHVRDYKNRTRKSAENTLHGGIMFSSMCEQKEMVSTLPMVLHMIYKSVTRGRLHCTGFKMRKNVRKIIISNLLFSCLLLY